MYSIVLFCIIALYITSHVFIVLSMLSSSNKILTPTLFLVAKRLESLGVITFGDPARTQLCRSITRSLLFMSARELRALKQNSPEFVPARLRSQVRKMSQQKKTLLANQKAKKWIVSPMRGSYTYLKGSW